MSHTLRIHYHRDFDGMVSAAVLAKILTETHDEKVVWSSVNYDQRRDWKAFGGSERFAIVDFHFHPNAEYWFDHHPTTFLTPELRKAYEPTDRWAWDEASPSCPPLILRHAAEHWGYDAPERFVDMAKWSDVVDAARFRDVEQAIFGDEPALRITRSMTAAPSRDYPDELVAAMFKMSLEEVACLPVVEKAHERAARNRDKALEQFPRTVVSISDQVLHYDASSSKVRRERFAPFYHHPELKYAVGVIPTRSGFHVTAGQNPFSPPTQGLHLGELMEKHGGGGHRAVAGANPDSLEAARELAAECAELLRAAVHPKS